MRPAAVAISYTALGDLSEALGNLGGASALPSCDAYSMSPALYGLLGALGGAFLTAAAAYWGPIQAQRRANAAVAEQARLAREAEAAARAEELARAEVERVRAEQVARHRARERQRDFAAENERRIARDQRHSAIKRIRALHLAGVWQIRSAPRTPGGDSVQARRMPARSRRHW